MAVTTRTSRAEMHPDVFVRSNSLARVIRLRANAVLVQISRQ